MYGLAKCVLILSAAFAASGFNLGGMDVIFHLFTRMNPQVSQPLLPSVVSIMTSSFQLGRPTIITIHSNGESVAGNFNAFVINAHLQAEDVNILAVDWSPGASMYTEGLGNAPQCGEIIANFVNILTQQFGYNAGLIRIVGVGLGGHIAGIAARAITGTIPHIIALDPSLHGWTHHPSKLSPDAAGIVEVLHTNAGTWGYDNSLGDIDFYANGGAQQLACGDDDRCSHIYSYIYYAESVTRDVNGGNRFVGTACESVEEALALQCSGSRDAIFGGIEVKTSGSGNYTFLTNMVPPFARD